MAANVVWQSGLLINSWHITLPRATNLQVPPAELVLESTHEPSLFKRYISAEGDLKHIRHGRRHLDLSQHRWDLLWILRRHWHLIRSPSRDPLFFAGTKIPGLAKQAIRG